MKFTGLFATSDLMGRRVRLGWGWVLDPLESVAQLPDVVLRRKERDFAFPPLVVGDPFLILDSAVFPPAPIPNVLTVTDLPDRSAVAAGLSARSVEISLARVAQGSPLEYLRHSQTIWRDTSGRPVRVEVLLLDARGLRPGVLQYYELDDGTAPGPEDIGQYRAIARAGEVWGLNRKLWDMLPEIYKGGDATPMPLTATIPGIPEAGRAGGQLKRFIDTFGMGLDTLRNGAEGLRRLRDVETTQPDALAALGQHIGWDVAPALPIEQSRNEVETATRLFAVGGTVQAMRALVTHQTGWRAQAAEMAQSLLRAGVPGEGHLRFSVERPISPGLFTGGLDASALFGFPPGTAVGGISLPASLIAGIAGPYALQPGLELTLTIDGAAPARIVFGPDDFTDMAQASAAEVAVVLQRHFDTVSARSQAGALVIETLLDTSDASLQVNVPRESLLALSEAKDGRIAAVADGAQLRLFYSQREERPAPGGGLRVLTRATTKAWGFGEWRDARALPGWADGAPEVGLAMLPTEIALTFAPDGQHLLLARGVGRAPAPAILSTPGAGPFQLLSGQKLTLVTEAGAETFLVNPADYVNPALATSAEIAAAMNVQLANVVASVLPGGVLRLTTVAVGDRAQLWIDLGNSNIARRLGLAARDLQAQGGWDDAIDWADPEPGPCVAGPLRDVTAAVGATGLVLGWAEHQAEAWQVRTARWQNLVTLATPNGVAQGVPGGLWTVWTLADGLPSSNIRAVVTDARGVLAAATDAGLGLRPEGAAWAAVTMLGGLPSNDLRALALLPDGRLVIATAAGLAEIDLAGAVTVTTSSLTGLIDNDLRTLFATAAGDLLIGSAGGLSRRDRFGQWSRWTVADGIPPGAVQCLAEAKGVIWLGTALGFSQWSGGTWQVVAGLPSTDVRSITLSGDGMLIAATAAGIAQRAATARAWTKTSPAEGLPMADCRAVVLGPGNRLLASGPAGLAVSGPQGAAPWALLGTADGLPAGGGFGLDGPWSVAFIAAAPTGGAKTPHLARMTSGEVWLTYSARATAVAADRDPWTLRLRRFVPAASQWQAEQTLTANLAPGSTDTAPMLLPTPLGTARLFFATDRSGGQGLAELNVAANGVAGAPTPFPLDSAEAGWPVAVTRTGGEVWLWHRGDRPFSRSQVATLAANGQLLRPSLRFADAATFHSPAGLRSPVLAHLPRHALRQHLGDPMAYTPDQPDIGGGAPGDPAPLNTRRTLVLHLGLAPYGLPPTTERLQRLIQLLNRFKPINIRLRLLIRPEPLVEIVYGAGFDIGERWADDLPAIEAIGAVGEAFGVRYPGLAVLLAHDLASRSIAFADSATFRRRTWFPDLI